MRQARSDRLSPGAIPFPRRVTTNDTKDAKDIDDKQLVGTEAPGSRVLRWTVGRR